MIDAPPEWPPISFGIIVLNGEPFTHYCLKALYPFASQIIVVEGATTNARSVATCEGHSRDRTLDVVRRFQAEHDPKGVVELVTAEDEGSSDGFWREEKDQMSQAFANRATGRYLWQVDIDEFYHPQDIVFVVEIMEKRRDFYAASFQQIQFWGGFSTYFDSWRLQDGAGTFHRLFRWQPGFRYSSHRPPTVLNQRGVDLRLLGHLRSATLARKGIFLYHYSFVFPRQVLEKCQYYARAFPDELGALEQWYSEVYLTMRRPFRVDHCGSPSWLLQFKGRHPPQVCAMVRDLETGLVRETVRGTADLTDLLHSPVYRLGRYMRMTTFRVLQRIRKLFRRIRNGVWR